MAEETGISWCDSTFNPWIGCDEVSPACDGCYARDLSERYGWAKWGPDEPRHRTAPAYWLNAHRWNASAPEFFRKHGRRRRVFAASLADIFDNKVPAFWRADFWALVLATPELQWLIVTKRIGNAAKMLPADWGVGYANVVVIATVVDQAEANRDIPKLLRTPAQLRGLSIEPMLGEIDLHSISGPAVDGQGTFFDLVYRAGPGQFAASGLRLSNERIDWVIVGGESGAKARAMAPHWPRILRDQCQAADIPFHFKQWGEWKPVWKHEAPGGIRSITMERVGVKLAGRKLDGIEYNGFPPQ